MMKNYLQALIIFVIVLCQREGYAQICVGQDTSVCINRPVQLNICNSLSESRDNNIVLPAPTSVTLADDRWSQIVNLGFNFNFYGQNYTQCVIGSNGLLSFNTTNANSNCEWSTTAVNTFPSTSFATSKNSIMLCYQDMNPSSGGAVYYQTIGTAPNREFYVVYENVQMFGQTICNYMSLILFESSNSIEFHISDKPTNINWNGGRATQGVQNSTGTIAKIVTGRNNTQWNAQNDAQKFTPTSPTNTSDYTYSPIPIKIVRRVNNSSSLVWRTTTGQSFPYNNGILTVPNTVLGRIGYYISMNVTACTSISALSGDTTWITVGNLSLTTSSTTDICANGQGTATVNASGGNGNYTYNWPSLGQTTQTATNVPTGTHAIQVTDAIGCTGNASVNVPNQTASFSSVATLVSCTAGSDGTATVTMTPELGVLTYLWSNGQTTRTATGLTAGSYTCQVTSSIGCSGTTTVIVNEVPEMQVSVDRFTDVTCSNNNDGSISLITSDGTAPYTYSLEFLQILRQNISSRFISFCS